MKIAKGMVFLYFTLSVAIFVFLKEIRTTGDFYADVTWNLLAILSYFVGVFLLAVKLKEH